MRRALLALAAIGISTVHALTGQWACADELCLTATRDNGIDTYTLQPVADIPHSHFGWMAVGWGAQMIGSPMVIVWPNEDGTFTLSQRQAIHHQEPPLVASPPRTATLESDLSWSNDTSTSITFTMPSNSDNTTSFIWALSNTNPANSDPGANLIEHTWRGVIFASMEADWTGNRIQMSSKFDTHSPANTKSGKASFALIAHITCGVLATMMVLPGGVVVPRITRGLTTSNWWFRFHQISQGICAIALIAAGFGIALRFGGELDSTHRKTGVALFALTIVQILLGLFAHYYTPGWRVRRFVFETKRGRGPSNFLHVIMGVIIVAVGWSTCWTGLTDEWHRRGHGIPKNGFRIGWGMIIMLWIAAYFLGIIFLLPRQLRIESKQRDEMRKYENNEVYRNSAVALANEYYMEERGVKVFSPTSDMHQLSPEVHGNGNDLPRSPTHSQYTFQSYPRSPETSPSQLNISSFGNSSSTYFGHFAAPGAPAPPNPSRPEGLDGGSVEHDPPATNLSANLSAVTIPITLAPSKAVSPPPPPRPPRQHNWNLMKNKI